MSDERQALLEQVRNYITSSNVDSLASWSSIGWLLTNYIARASYALPIAGYVILYSDMFQPLFKFKLLEPYWHPFSFNQRIYMYYFGGVFLLASYCLYWWFSPPPRRTLAG